MDIINVIATELGVKDTQVQKTIELLDEGNTVPFIARYRKEATGNLSDEQLRDLNDRLTYLRNLEARKQEVTTSIENQGKMTEEIAAALAQAMTLADVEDIYRPYKQKKKTRATVAKAKGLEPLANDIFAQESTSSIYEEAKNYLNDEVETPEDALAGAKDIIAEQISDDTEFRKMIKKIYNKEAVIKTEGTKPEEKTNYNMYYEFEEKVGSIPSHRILAINRGEKEEFLKVKIVKPDDKILYSIVKKTIKNWDAVLKFKDNLIDTDINNITPDISREELIVEAIVDGWYRLTEPSVDREIRADLTEKADEQAIKVFGKNAKQLLLGAPLKGLTVLGFDPAYRTGCKLAIIDETGKVLGTGVVYPTEPQNDVEGSKKTLIDMFNKYGINMVAIGNGTASRESEQFDN